MYNSSLKTRIRLKETLNYTFQIVVGLFNEKKNNAYLFQARMVEPSPANQFPDSIRTDGRHHNLLGLCCIPLFCSSMSEERSKLQDEINGLIEKMAA